MLCVSTKRYKNPGAVELDKSRFVFILESSTSLPHELNTFPNNVAFTCLQYNPCENTAGQGEITRYVQFHIFPQCFLPFQGTFYHFHQI